MKNLTLTPNETIGFDCSNGFFHSSEIGFVVPRFDIQKDGTLGNESGFYKLKSRIDLNVCLESVLFAFLAAYSARRFFVSSLASSSSEPNKSTSSSSAAAAGAGLASTGFLKTKTK